MAMQGNDMSRPDLDAIIEEALSSEPMRPAPVGLYRAICCKVRLAALAEQERRMFRRTLASALAVVILVLAVLKVLASTHGVRMVFDQFAPGAMGQYDYAASSIGIGWGGLGALALAIAVCLAGFTAIVLIIPSRSLRT